MSNGKVPKCKEFVVENTKEIYEVCGYEDEYGRFHVETQKKVGKL